MITQGRISARRKCRGLINIQFTVLKIAHTEKAPEKHGTLLELLCIRTNDSKSCLKKAVVTITTDTEWNSIKCTK